MASAEQTVIRPANEDDCELLVELIRELAGYEKLADKVVGDAEVLRRTLFEQRAAEALVLEAGGEPIGYAIFFATSPASSAARGSGSRTSTSVPSTAAAASVAWSWSTWRRSPWSAATSASNGARSTGTSRR